MTALQFAPQQLLLPWIGSAADHFDQTKLLVGTQTAMGGLALALGALTVTGLVQLWQVYVFACLSGRAAAFDASARQVFVSQLVGDEDLHNAVTLNSMSFNAANLVGSAVSGLMTAAVGTGWSFLLNGLSFLAVLTSLFLFRPAELHPARRASRRPGSFLDGLHYVRGRADLIAVLAMLFPIGAFALNFPVFVSTMAVRVFHVDARGFGVLTSVMAVGTVAGALWSATRERPSPDPPAWSGALIGIGFTLASLAPTYWTYAAALVVVGLACLVFVVSTNAMMQLSTVPEMRGRMMALRVGVTLGGNPIGAPIGVFVADHFGSRCALGIDAAAGFAAAALAFARVRPARAFPAAPTGES